jgi:Leucine-rich repeat (LRR) protein
MIRIIALCSNLIESISLEGFPNLTSLDLSNNKIKSLKDVLHLNECRALKKIFMDDNKITSFLELTANL